MLTFYQFWSLKEAALKSIGEGLPFGLYAFEFEVDPKINIDTSDSQLPSCEDYLYRNPEYPIEAYAS